VLRARRPSIAAAALLAVAPALPGAPGAGAAAQEPDGSLAVLVRQELSRGGPVSGALVRVAGTPLFQLTDSAGAALFPGIAPGEYTVLVSAAGFADEVRTRVAVGPGERAEVEVSLGLPVFDVPSLVVTASRGAERFGETTASVDVISDGDLERLGALEVDEGLRFASGVTFNAGQIDIRGATGLARGVGSRVLVLMDGHRFLSGATGGVSFEAVPPLSVERVEVVKGPASTLYGSGALGGVVNVLRRPVPEEPRTTARVHGGVYDQPAGQEFTGELLSYQGVDARHARRIGPLGAFVEVGRRSSDGYRQNDHFDRWLFHGGLTVPRAEGPPVVELFGLWSREDRGRFFQWRSRERPLEVERDALGDRVDADEWSVGATVTPWISEDAVVEIRPGVYGSRIQNHFRENRDFHRSERYDADAQLSVHRWRRHVITTGIEGAYTRVTSNFLGRPDVVDGALFVQDEATLTPELRATAGLRMDHHDADPGAAETTLNPRIGAVWSPGDVVRFRASLARGYRAPSPVEQFVTATRSGFDVIPNLELRGESSWAVEAGITGRLREWLWVDAGLFRSRFDDLIEPSPVPGRLFTFQFRNVQDARVRGLDLGARLGFRGAPLQGRLGYLLLDSRDLGRDVPLPYRSRHNVTASVDAGPVGLDLRHRSRVERVLAFPLDPREPITVVDLRLGFQALGVRGQIKVGNVFQETYVNVQERTPGPTRSVQILVTSTF